MDLQNFKNKKTVQQQHATATGFKFGRCDLFFFWKLNFRRYSDFDTSDNNAPVMWSVTANQKTAFLDDTLNATAVTATSASDVLKTWKY